MSSDPHTDDLETQSVLLARLRANTHTTNALKLLPPPEPLVEDLLFLDSLAMLYGPTGEGKSFVAIDWALSVATGLDWCEKPVAPGRVIYVSAEGRGGLGQRITAWEQAHGAYDETEHDQIDWVVIPVNLFEPAWVDALVESARDPMPALVILDTLNMCSIGSDENSAKDMGIILEGARRIREATDACVLIVHHTGKDAGRGARGHSALKAAVDTEIECAAAGHSHTLTVTKQRDVIALSPIGLVRREVADSCVMELGDHESTSYQETGSEKKVLAALREIDLPTGVSSGVWEAEAKSAGVSSRSFHRAKAKLLTKGLVVNLSPTGHQRYKLPEADGVPLLPPATPKGGGSGRQ